MKLSAYAQEILATMNAPIFNIVETNTTADGEIETDNCLGINCLLFNPMTEDEQVALDELELAGKVRFVRIYLMTDEYDEDYENPECLEDEAAVVSSGSYVSCEKLPKKYEWLLDGTELLNIEDKN